MVSREKTDYILDFSFHRRRRESIRVVAACFGDPPNRRKALRRFKPMKATQVITVDDK